MATLTFAYNHARDPMNPGDLAFKILTVLSLASMPQVDITPTQILVTHANVTSANTAAIQSVISAYVLDPNWQVLQPNDASLLTARMRQAFSANATFLAIASPTTAQVATQAKALTRQVNALLRIQLGDLSTVSDT